MDGPAIGSNAAHDRLGRFTAGNSEHARKRDRIAALVDQLAAEYEAASPVAKQLLRIAALHLDTAATSRNNILRGRSTRLAAKILDRLEHRPQPPKLNAFDQFVLDRKREASR